MILFLLDISLWKILLDLVLLFFGQANREFYIELDVEITLGERLVEVLSINLNVLLGHTFIADLLNVVRSDDLVKGNVEMSEIEGGDFQGSTAEGIDELDSGSVYQIVSFSLEFLVGKLLQFEDQFGIRKASSFVTHIRELNDSFRV